MLDWIAFLLIMTLFFAFASTRFVAMLKAWVTTPMRVLLMLGVLLIPYMLVGWRSTPFITGLAIMIVATSFIAFGSLWRPKGAKPLHPLDILVILAIWFPIEFDWLPDVDLILSDDIAFPVTTLTIVTLSFFCFLVLRPLPQFGYTYRLSKSDFRAALTAIVATMAVMVPFGLLINFLELGVAPVDVFYVAGWPLIYLFTAIPEEMLFRGVMQQQMHGRFANKNMALLLASFIFGLAHLNNSTLNHDSPNWAYVIMATIAGLAYGWTYRKTGKISAAANAGARTNARDDLWWWKVFRRNCC